MSKQVLPFVRQKQILSTLYEHGPLSIRALQRILEPPITLRRLQDATKRLRKSGLIARRFNSLPLNASNFFHLAQHELARKVLAEMLNKHPDQILQPYFRNQELHHSELCAIWAARFKKLFPDCRIVRDFKLIHDELAQNILLGSKKEMEVKPDLFVQFPRANDNGYISIALEIERTRKTKVRLRQKVSTYALKTRLDGVIYLCDNNAIVESVRHIYLDPKSTSYIRVGHFKKNFIMFSKDEIPAFGEEPKMYNAELENTSLKNWINFLASTKFNFRRDHNFTRPA